MKKVGILTFHRANNYGSVLQAHALSSYISQLGYPCEIIDFRMKRQEELYSSLYAPWNSAANFARNMYTIPYAASLRKAQENFEMFRSKRLPIGQTYWDEIPQTLGSEDRVFVMGGDQIWNTTLLDFDKTFVGAFAKDKRKCVSYAPSIGMKNLSDENRRALRGLKDFGALSVREEEGKKILEELLERKVQTVCDPVFLCDKGHWETVAAEGNAKKGVFMYLIGDTNGARQLCSKIHKETGLRVFSYYKSIRDAMGAIQPCYGASPMDFLAGIKNSEVVITNSFHATAFSIIFKKNFWVCLQRDDTKRPQTRLVNLLRKVNLLNRIIYEDMPTDEIDYQRPIDYKSCQADIEQWIFESATWLKKCLGQANH